MKRVHAMKKGQGLPISTIILAALGLVVLIVLFALVTGRLGILGRELTECPGACLGTYTGDTPDPSVECDPQLTREYPGVYIQKGQPGVPQERIKKCSKCCLALT